MLDIEKIKAFFKNDIFATELCGIEILEVEDGRAVCAMEIKSGHKNAGNAVQGGAIFTLADFTFAVAANSCGNITVSLDCTVSFMRPAKEGRLTAYAKKRGGSSTVCFYDVAVKDGLGELIAKASITGYIKKQKHSF